MPPKVAAAAAAAAASSNGHADNNDKDKDKQPPLTRTEYAAQILVSAALIALEVMVLLRVKSESHEYFKRGENAYAHSSWVYPIVGTTGYLFVIVGLGQRYFASRAPWRMDGFMLAYNAFQTVFNIWAVASFLAEVYRRGLPFAGTKYVPGLDEEELGFLIYAHYQNKYLEFLDTVFMVVRKKTEQVSTLHVFHHSVIAWSWFAVLLTNPGGDAYFGALMNSGIHALMYPTYALALLKVPCPWKRYLTMMQMTQFCIIFVQGWYAIYLGSTPTWLTLIQQFVMAALFVMFADFYRRSYNKPKGGQAGGKAGKSAKDAKEE